MLVEQKILAMIINMQQNLQWNLRDRFISTARFKHWWRTAISLYKLQSEVNSIVTSKCILNIHHICSNVQRKTICNMRMIILFCWLVELMDFCCWLAIVWCLMRWKSTVTLSLILGWEGSKNTEKILRSCIIEWNKIFLKNEMKNDNNI